MSTLAIGSPPAAAMAVEFGDDEFNRPGYCAARTAHATPCTTKSSFSNSYPLENRAGRQRWLVLLAWRRGD